MATHGTPDKDQGLNLPKSTNKVKYEGPAQDIAQDVGDGSSTGAVKLDKTNLGKIENDALASIPEGDGPEQDRPASKIEFPHPEGPTTMTTSWLSDAEAKVITAQHHEDYERSIEADKPRKSRKAETPAEPRAETKTPDQPDHKPGGRRAKSDEEGTD